MWNVLNVMGSMLTEDGRCTCEIKSTIAMAKAAFNKKKNPFPSKFDLNVRKRLVRCYISSVALYGAEIWTLGTTDQKHLESFEMWCWKEWISTEPIVWGMGKCYSLRSGFVNMQINNLFRIKRETKMYILSDGKIQHIYITVINYLTFVFQFQL